MIVAGGVVPATNLTRHDVHRPRPPQVAVMSTPAAWAEARMVDPGSTWSARPSGRIVRAMLIRGQDTTSRLFSAALCRYSGATRRAPESTRTGRAGQRFP